MATSLFEEGPGSFCSSGLPERWVIKTAISHEEIGSFVTIFRRLSMESEPGNLDSAAKVFSDALAGHPVATWVQDGVTEYNQSLDLAPTYSPILGSQKMPFTRKRLFDVYIYTQYAHQPNERRTRQFNECLAAVGGNKTILAWLFLTEIWKAGLEIRNAGAQIVNFYGCYCQVHGQSPSLVASLRVGHPGLGTLEKKADQESRVLREKAEELAKTLWERAGRPSGGHSAWVKPALEQLMTATGRGGSSA